jgi:hypothetical protein
MPATEKAKAKHLYHTGYPCEEHMQAARCNVQQCEVPICAVVCLHQVRLRPNHIHYKLTVTILPPFFHFSHSCELMCP